MPESILINGRGSASPDRHVSFGNIERYDILTCNQIKNSQTKRQHSFTLTTPSGDYPMTRLDNRVRKAIILGFSYLPGDTVTYNDIIDYLLEFEVIPNSKVCNQRQITAVIQASFPKVIVRPSVKHSILFINLENRSDDVIKEELVRVTTEPVVDPVEEASSNVIEWITGESEKFLSIEEGEDEELRAIEERAMKRQKYKSAKKEAIFSSPPPMIASSPSDAKSLLSSDVEIIQEFLSSDAAQGNSYKKSHSLSDIANATEKTRNDSPSKSKLKRTHSFQRSTDRNYVGSIRDKFRTLMNSNSTVNKSKALNENDNREQKCNGKKEDKLTKTKNITSKSSGVISTSPTLHRDDLPPSNSDYNSAKYINETETSVDRPIRRTHSLKKVAPREQKEYQKYFPPPESSNGRVRQISFRGAKEVVSQHAKSKESSPGKYNSNKNTSNQKNPIRRMGSSKGSLLNDHSASRESIDGDLCSRRSIQRYDILSNHHQKEATTKNGSHTALSKPKLDRKNKNGAFEKNSIRDKRGGSSPIKTHASFGSSSFNERKTSPSHAMTRRDEVKPAERKPVKNLRKYSRKTNISDNESVTSSVASSVCSTPDLSSDAGHDFEMAGRLETKEEKDIIRIAKAFQLANVQKETINDNIAKFMKKIAIEDLELSNNNRLSLDHLYDHIRRKMIVAKDDIFEGTRSDFTVEMSQYFELFFTTLATIMDRVGCEIITDQLTGEKSCYLTHVRLCDTSNDILSDIENTGSYV